MDVRLYQLSYTLNPKLMNFKRLNISFFVLVFGVKYNKIILGNDCFKGKIFLV